MAERRYGFRFSFAEGCVIVVSMMSASFLVFLFGVYAGRELEARKTAEHTRTVRLAAFTGEQRVHDPSRAGALAAAGKEGQEKPAGSFPVPQEAPKTVVVVTPQKPSEPSAITTPVPAAPAPVPAQENESPAKPETPRKTPTDLASQEVKSAAPTPSTFQEKKLPPKEAAPPSPPPKKLQVTGGRWSVQIHATRDEESARQLAKRLRSQGYVPVVSKIVRDGEIWYRVRIGSFANADEARASVGRFRREGKFSQAYPVSN